MKKKEEMQEAKKHLTFYSEVQHTFSSTDWCEMGPNPSTLRLEAKRRRWNAVTSRHVVVSYHH